MGTECSKGGLHVSRADAHACEALPNCACDAFQRADVPAAEPDLAPVAPVEVAGDLTAPTPVKDESLTPNEQKVVEVVADVAAAVAAKESGAHNSTA